MSVLYAFSPVVTSKIEKSYHESESKSSLYYIFLDEEPVFCQTSVKVKGNGQKRKKRKANAMSSILHKPKSFKEFGELPSVCFKLIEGDFKLTSTI